MTLDEPVVDRLPPTDKPIPLLGGLFVGTLTIALCVGYYWPFAWILPGLLGAATYPWLRTRQFGLGAFAAACGAAVGVFTEMILILLWH